MNELRHTAQLSRLSPIFAKEADNPFRNKVSEHDGAIRKLLGLPGQAVFRTFVRKRFSTGTPAVIRVADHYVIGPEPFTLTSYLPPDRTFRFAAGTVTIRCRDNVVEVAVIANEGGETKTSRFDLKEIADAVIPADSAGELNITEHESRGFTGRGDGMAELKLSSLTLTRNATSSNVTGNYFIVISVPTP